MAFYIEKKERPMAFYIEKNVPAPTHRGKYPFGEMGVGDSFQFPFAKSIAVRNAANGFGLKYGRKFLVRKDGDAARVWRTQ